MYAGKAFDTVPHLPLLHTFDDLGLDNYLFRWLKNYLFNRTQYVAVEGADSHILPVLSGVPRTGDCPGTIIIY